MNFSRYDWQFPSNKKNDEQKSYKHNNQIRSPTMPKQIEFDGLLFRVVFWRHAGMPYARHGYLACCAQSWDEDTVTFIDSLDDPQQLIDYKGIYSELTGMQETIVEYVDHLGVHKLITGNGKSA